MKALLLVLTLVLSSAQVGCGGLVQDGPIAGIDINPELVQQGSFGDCWFLSVLIATAQARQGALQSLFTRPGGKGLDVTVYSPLGWAERYPAIVPTDPIYGNVIDPNAFNWVGTLELAAQKVGFAGQISNGSDPIVGFGIIGLSPSVLYSGKDPAVHSVLEAAYGTPTVACTGPKVSTPELVESHCYAVTSAGQDTVTLQNPWGVGQLGMVNIGSEAPNFFGISLEDFKTNITLIVYVP